MPRFLLFLALLLPADPVLSAAPLYVGEVPVERAERAGTAEQLQALDQVLARLTGRFSSSLVRELGLGSGHLDTLVLSQQMVRRSVVLPEGGLEDSVRLQIEFDSPAVNTLLQRNDLPRWGRERPAVLLWMSVEDESGARLAEDPWLEYVVSETARRVGLDVLRPLGDARDLAEVTLEDVRGGFLGSAEASSRRYGAGVIAMLDLRVRREGASERSWAARWRWRVEGQDSGLDHSGERPDMLIHSGLERLASALAARYAATEHDGVATPRVIRVGGIVDEVQYAEVLRHLENLSMIESIRVLGAREREVTFELMTDRADIETLLRLGGLLELERREIDGQLYFRLAP